MTNQLYVQRMFALLRSALWGEHFDNRLLTNLSDADFLAIYHLGSAQALSAIIADALLNLPLEHRPSGAMLVSLLRHIASVSATNDRHREVIRQLSEHYAHEGLSWILLKGLGLAQCYPHPQLRAPGDIDVYFPSGEDYQRANLWSRTTQAQYLGCQHHEYRFAWEGITIEHHRQLSAQRAYYDSALAAALRQALESEGLHRIDIGAGTMVSVLPPTMGAVYIFQHLFLHFTYQGVGLRQYIDWLMFLAHHRHEIDPHAYTATASRLDLLRPMRHFARTAVEYLGAPEDIFPFTLPAHSRYTSAIMNLCLRGGNFGAELYGASHYPSRIAQLWHKYQRNISVSIRLFGLSPAHIGLLPWTSIFRRR